MRTTVKRLLRCCRGTAASVGSLHRQTKDVETTIDNRTEQRTQWISLSFLPRLWGTYAEWIALILTSGKIGNRVETSGQGGWDDDLQIPESLADEIAQAFRNVERTLRPAGAGWEHVVHVNSYHVGEGFPEVNDVDGHAIHAQPRPNLDG